MKIEVGGVYRSRCGERVEIVYFRDSPDNPYVDSNGDNYNSRGRYYNDWSDSKYDLIEPWSDTKEDTYITILEAIAGPDVCAMARKIKEALIK